MPKYEAFCGCCGAECSPHYYWCEKCMGHISTKPNLPNHLRTYFAQHGKDCPFQVYADKPTDKK